jgi:hypothetical protein
MVMVPYIELTGLTSGTSYFFHLRSDCNADGLSLWVSTPFTTHYTCMTDFYDTGGSDNNYDDNENTVRMICPENIGEVVTVNFLTFNVEQNWDALYIYDGDNTSSPLLSSGNPETLAGFPAGGYYGVSSPGTFTSTHNSGCLTTKFLSDAFVTEFGWYADISCQNVCSNMVSSTQDSGAGTLRFNSNCLADGSTLFFSSSLQNDTIFLNTPIVLNKSITLSNLHPGTIFIKVNNAGPVFQIEADRTVNLFNLTLLSGNQAIGRAIINHGICNLDNVTVIDESEITGGNTIQNNGILNIDGTVQIKD